MSSEIKKALGIGGKYDKRSADFLSAAIASNMREDFDYIKFKKSLNQMATLHLDEETAIKSAFATASTIGVTKSTLTKSAGRYLKVLMHEKSQFDAALNNQVKQRIASKKEEVLKLQKRIEDYRKKIEDLKDRIEEYQSKIENADHEVDKAKQKIQETKDKFEQTFNAFVEIIQKDVELINKNL